MPTHSPPHFPQHVQLCNILWGAYSLTLIRGVASKAKLYKFLNAADWKWQETENEHSVYEECRRSAPNVPLRFIVVSMEQEEHLHVEISFLLPPCYNIWDYLIFIRHSWQERKIWQEILHLTRCYTITGNPDILELENIDLNYLWGERARARRARRYQDPLFTT